MAGSAELLNLAACQPAGFPRARLRALFVTRKPQPASGLLGDVVVLGAGH